MKKITFLFMLFAAFTTVASAQTYLIKSFNRGGYLTSMGDNQAIQHADEAEGSYWYFTEADDNGGVYFCNKATSQYLGADLTMSDTPAVWYILPNGVNEEGISISKTNPISSKSCIDANNYDTGVGFWAPNAGDWNGTTWVLIDIEETEEEYNALAAEATSIIEKSKISINRENVALQITDPSAPCYISCSNVDPKEGTMEGLIDGNPNTFMHSNWHSVSAKNDWLDLDMGEGNSIQSFQFSEVTRSGAANDYPASILIQGSNDGANYDDITTVSGLPQYGGATWTSNIIEANQPYRYLRFVVTTGTNRIYFHMAEFSIVKINEATINEAYKPALSEILSMTKILNIDIAKAKGATPKIGEMYEVVKQLKPLMQAFTEKTTYVLNDNGIETYTNDADKQVLTIEYNRNFEHTHWQALYVPFTMKYSDWSEDFDVARITQLGQTYKDGEMHMHIYILYYENGSTLNPNTPYLIRPKSAGAKTIKVENTTLYKAETTPRNCSTMDYEVYFTGTYNGVSGSMMYNNEYYALREGQFTRAANETVSLGAYRWYLTLQSRDVMFVNNKIKFFIEKEGTTNIEEIEGSNFVAPVYYDLSGRKVENPTSGIYIVNGKKVYVK